jgi:HAD superfamily hydrolase (TIGR01549 family)
MPQHEIKAVLFDLGDTLLNFGRVRTTGIFIKGARRSYDYLKAQGQPTGPFLWYCVRNLVRLRLVQLRYGLAGKDFDALTYLEGVGRKEGVQLTPEQWEEFAWLWYEPLSQLADTESDLRETLTALRELGLKLGVVSNTFVNRASLERHLRSIGVLDLFSELLFSCEYEFRKPHLALFRIAAEKVGEALENVLFVGDRIDKDIRPALATGMRAALKDAYTNRGRENPPGAWRIQRIAELPALIEQVNAGIVSGTCA